MGKSDDELRAIIQVLPGGRARVDPVRVPEVACYLWAFAARYRREARMTLTGTVGAGRKRRAGQIHRAKLMLHLVDALVTSLNETVDLREYDAAVREWQEALSAPAQAGT